jgi:Peptidase family M28
LSDSSAGWKQLLPPASWYRRPGAYPIAAYSEFMPPPRLGGRAYGGGDPLLFADDDPWGWQVTEYEEANELRPGLAHIAGELLRALQRLGRAEAGHGIGKRKLTDNPFWPAPLLAGGAPPQEAYLVLASLALARTQDDKGRVRWTLFGGSDQGPARPFWRGFWRGPGQEMPAGQGLAFCRRLIAAAGAAVATPEPSAPLAAAAATRDLLAAGFRILPGGLRGLGPAADAGLWDDGPLPTWTTPLLWHAEQPVTGLRYLLTFRPFARLPEAVRQAYLSGALRLLPFPGSLLFWGAAPYRVLAGDLPQAPQLPLLHTIARSEDPHRLRVPQSGWLHEPHPGYPQPETEHGPMRNSFRRTHRWERVERHQDGLAVAGFEDRMAHVLFSAAADDLGLYGKPMARNAQIWTRDYRLLLDGPRAERAELTAAASRLAAGGTFGYRFLYPAMRVGEHEVFWHRLLAAHPVAGESRAALLEDAPLGYLTASPVAATGLAPHIELWPRLLARPAHLAALVGLHGGHFTGAAAGRGKPSAAGPEIAGYRRTVNNCRKLLDAWQLLGGTPLPPSFARALLRLPKGETLDAWLEALASVAPEAARESTALPPIVGELRQRIAMPGPPAASPSVDAGAPAASAQPAGALAAPSPAAPRTGPTGTTAPSGLTGAMAGEPSRSGEPEPLTYGVTGRRRFEIAYWRRIAFLAEGRFVNKDNADCVRDPVTQAHLRHRQRDLEALGDYLLAYYRKAIDAQGMSGRAMAGDLPFRWQTDFELGWSGGWLGNQRGEQEERNLMVVIPGRDRGRAVIMADHYDTAYMEDRFGYQHGGHGPRLAAAGADDNHSATAALMLAAPIFLELAASGRLACDVWLVHLTGEEFPSDCLGARHLTQSLVEGTLRLRTRPDGWTDLSAARVEGVYVSDMIAHNNDHDRDVFQICPGSGAASLWLAREAHLANQAWNRLAPLWNRRSRRGSTRGRRSADGRTLPVLALHPQLLGEVRPPTDPHSTLYNTDGQIFSDAGVPVVLFMENYDINRHGYHDSHDTMENIDLDYGAAVAAITIETVARVATAPPPRLD